MNCGLPRTPKSDGMGRCISACRRLCVEPDHGPGPGFSHGNKNGYGDGRHDSRFTTHDSRFTTHDSRFIGHGKEAGYTLVMFVIVIAVMSIAMGVAVQTASFQMQREKEAELIFRGQQFIEAIRLYKTKYGRYPMQLKEIYEAKPRVIRKKWKDPITDSESWGLIFLGQDGQQAGRRGRQLAGAGPATPSAAGERRPSRRRRRSATRT